MIECEIFLKKFVVTLDITTQLCYIVIVTREVTITRNLFYGGT